MAKRGIESLYNRVGKELHSKKTLDNVPVRWRSAPNHPETQLAYITDAEAALLKELDIHDSGVRYNHHIGPLGIPSYNGAGSGDSAGGSNDSAGGSPAGDGGGTMGGGSFGGDGGGVMGGGGYSGGAESGSPAGDTGGVMGGGDFGGAGGSPAGDGGGVMGGGADIGGGVMGGGDIGGGNIGGTDAGSVTSGSSLADAMGATQAGAFGTSGVVGVDAGTTTAQMGAQGISPTTDVSGALSTMGLGDISMGAFGPGGITGTGISADGVSGLGMGGGTIAGGLGTLGDLGALGALGPVGSAGFATTSTGFSTSPTSTPFGGASTGVAPGAVAPSTGMGFGMIGSTGLFAGAPYDGADVMTGLATGGIPGTRGDALAEQQAAMAAQVAANPTFSAPTTMSNQQIAAALQAGLLSAPSIPSVPAALAAPTTPAVSPTTQTSTLATAAATPVSAAPAPAPSVAPAAAAPVSAAPAPAAPSAPAPATPSAPSPSAPSQAAPSAPATSAATSPSRAASSVSVDTFADPLTGNPVSVTTYSDGTQTVSSPTAQSGGWGQTALSSAVNLGTGLLGPAGLGLQGLSYVGTGQSLGTNVANLAFGGGLNPVGGVLGGGPTAGYGTGASNPNLSQGDGGGGYYVPTTTADRALTSEAVAQQAQQDQQSQRPPLTPVSYPLEQFVAQPVQMFQMPPRQYVPVPQPQSIAYGRPYAPVGPGIASIPTFFNRPSGTTQFYG